MYQNLYVFRSLILLLQSRVSYGAVQTKNSYRCGFIDHHRRSFVWWLRSSRQNRSFSTDKPATNMRARASRPLVPSRHGKDRAQNGGHHIGRHDAFFAGAACR